jgi:predicted helicase
MKRMVSFYNSEVLRFNHRYPGLDPKQRQGLMDAFIDTDASQISWSVYLKQALAKDKTFEFESEKLIRSLYRPYTKQWLYFSRDFNERVLQMPRIFATPSKGNWSDALITNQVISSI